LKVVFREIFGTETWGTHISEQNIGTRRRKEFQNTSTQTGIHGLITSDVHKRYDEREPEHGMERKKNKPEEKYKPENFFFQFV